MVCSNNQLINYPPDAWPYYMPYYHYPHYGTPFFAGPQYGSPHLEVSHYGGLHLDIPHLDVPHFDVPHIEIPHVRGEHISSVRNFPQSGQGLYPQLLGNILKAIKGEAEAVDYYSRLIQMAPNELHRSFIQHALEDEQVHLRQFSKLYKVLSGQEPQYSVTSVPIQSYQEGLFRAYLDELEAYDFYSEIYLSTQDQQVKDIFVKAIIDEIEHANRFSFLYVSTRE